MIDRAVRALREAADDVILAASDPQAATWLPGVTVVRDTRTGVGALGGVHAALTAAASAVLTLPWDAPFVPGALLRALREAGELEGADAAVPVSDSPWGFEPLCAWYAPTALAAVERLIESGDHRAGSLERHVSVLRVDVRAFGDPNTLFFNVNTPADLAHAEELVAARGTR